jgi:hypothetical protein
MAEVWVNAYGEYGRLDCALCPRVRQQGFFCQSRKFLRDGTFLTCWGDLGHEEDHWAYGKQDSFNTWKLVG